MVDIASVKASAGGIVGSIVWGIIWALIGAGIIWLIWMWLARKKFDYLVRIWRPEHEESKHLIQVGVDKGGIIMDKKTSYRLFKLQKYKAGLSPDSIPFFYGVKNQKIVDVLQVSLKEFRFLDRPIIVTNSPEAIGYGVQDKNIAWAINEIERANNYRKKSTLEAILPFLGMAFVFVTVVVALYFIFNKAGFNAELLKSLAQSSEKISQNLIAANSGTTIVSGAGG